MKGIDYSFGRPGGKVIKESGYDFVCRYLSNNPKKNLTKDELEDFRENDLKVVLVWETTELRPLGGFSGGAEDAKIAIEQATLLGLPDNKCIYFACDSDFKLSSFKTIEDYFNGIASVLPLNKIGVYGGIIIVDRLLDYGLCKFAWQTSAWSNKLWDIRVNLKQFTYPTLLLNKVQCDYNESCTDDFGQW